MPDDDDDSTLDTHALARLLDTPSRVVETALPGDEDANDAMSNDDLVRELQGVDQ